MSDYMIVPVPIKEYEDRYMVSTKGEVFRIYKYRTNGRKWSFRWVEEAIR